MFLEWRFEMLVLSRKVRQRIYLGDNIVVEIRRITGNRVTLALDAPGNVRILRGELREQELRAETNSASTPRASGKSKNQPAS